MLITESQLRGQFKIRTTILDPSERFNIVKRNTRREECYVSSLEELCKVTNRDTVAYDTLEAFVDNMVRWIEMDGDKTKVSWPDTVIRTKLGCCLDFAILIHSVFDYHNIDNRMMLVWFTDPGPTQRRYVGHCATLFRTSSGEVYVWNYLRNGFGDLNGPFQNYEAAIQQLPTFFAVFYNSYTTLDLGYENRRKGNPSLTTMSGLKNPYGMYLSDKMVAVIDHVRDSNTNIDQGRLFTMMGLGNSNKGFFKPSKESEDRVPDLYFPKPTDEGIKKFMELTKDISVLRNKDRLEEFMNACKGGKKRKSLLSREK